MCGALAISAPDASKIAFSASIGLGIALILSADGPRSLVASIVYAVSVALMFGASALYHRPTWTPRVRTRLARVDHAGIYLLIAGTYTAVGLLVFSTAWAATVLSIVWAGAVAAIAIKMFWVGAPKWLSAAIGIGLGWVGVVAFSQLLRIQVVGLLLLLAGGLLYTAGGLVYAFKRPDPVPQVFGYHELFHALVIAAVGCQYACIAFFVLD